jgi:hypothetical protein
MDGKKPGKIFHTEKKLGKKPGNKTRFFARFF